MPWQRRLLGRLFHRLIDRQIEDAGHGTDFAPNPLTRAEEERVDQRAGFEPGLANQRTKRLGAAKPPHAGYREFHTAILPG